jgi:hypothetical protein
MGSAMVIYSSLPLSKKGNYQNLPHNKIQAIGKTQLSDSANGYLETL